MKIVVKPRSCRGHSTCVEIAPDVFKVGANGKVVVVKSVASGVVLRQKSGSNVWVLTNIDRESPWDRLPRMTPLWMTCKTLLAR